MMTVRPEIGTIFSEVFKFRDAISSETSRDDVPKWDSLQHIALIAALEQRFGITLSMDEMVEIRSVRDINNVLDRHGA